MKFTGYTAQVFISSMHLESCLRLLASSTLLYWIGSDMTDKKEEIIYWSLKVAHRWPINQT